MSSNQTCFISFLCRAQGESKKGPGIPAVKQQRHQTELGQCASGEGSVPGKGRACSLLSHYPEEKEADGERRTAIPGRRQAWSRNDFALVSP